MTTILQPDDYLPRIDAHARRAAPWADARADRRARDDYHPVWDFLFDYYPVRASQLERWHPGLWALLVDAPRGTCKCLPGAARA